METNLNKIANKGTFKSFDVESNNLLVTIPKYNEDTGKREDVEVNLNFEYHSNHLTELDNQIEALKKEKKLTQDILDRFKVKVDEAKSKYVAE